MKCPSADPSPTAAVSVAFSLQWVWWAWTPVSPSRRAHFQRKPPANTIHSESFPRFATIGPPSRLGHSMIRETQVLSLLTSRPASLGDSGFATLTTSDQRCPNTDNNRCCCTLPVLQHPPQATHQRRRSRRQPRLFHCTAARNHVADEHEDELKPCLDTTSSATAEHLSFLILQAKGRPGPSRIGDTEVAVTRQKERHLVGARGCEPNHKDNRAGGQEAARARPRTES